MWYNDIKGFARLKEAKERKRPPRPQWIERAVMQSLATLALTIGTGSDAIRNAIVWRFDKELTEKDVQSMADALKAWVRDKEKPARPSPHTKEHCT